MSELGLSHHRLLLVPVPRGAGRVVAVALTAAAIAGGPAAGAPAMAGPWSPPAPIGGPSVESFPRLVLAPSGPRGVAWTADVGGTATRPPQTVTFVSPLGPGLQPGPPDPLATGFGLASGDAAADFFAADRRDRVVLAGTAAHDSALPMLGTGPLTGPLRVRSVGARVRAVAVNAAGDAAVLVEPCGTRLCHPAAPRVLVRRHGHRFGRPLVLDRRGLGYGASVAIDPHGRVLAAWDRNGAVHARFVGPRGRLGRLQRLGHEAAPSVFQAVLPGDGRAGIAWTSQRLGETGAGSPFTATVAMAGASRRFGRPRVLETVPLPVPGGLGMPAPGLVLRLPARAPGLLAWTGGDGPANVVRVAPVVGTTVGATQTVSAPVDDAVLADAAEGPEGDAVLLLRPGAGSAPGSAGLGGLIAVTRSAADAPFGAPESILAAPPMLTPGAADVADVAIDGASGAALAVWRSFGTPMGWSVRAPLR